MEKEVLEIFAVAKSAGEAAAADGGAPEVARCLDALRQLGKMPVTTKVLVATKVGKTILCLTKHPEKKIRTVASELREHWKCMVIEEVTNARKKKDTSEDQVSPRVGERSDKSASVKDERAQSSGSMRVDGVTKFETLKSERHGVHENISASGSAKVGNSVKVETTGNDRNGDKSIKVEKVTREENQHYPIIRNAWNGDESIKVEKVTMEENQQYPVIRNDWNGDKSMKVEKVTREENQYYPIIRNDRIGDKSIKVERVTREENQHYPIIRPPPKLTSMLKCNDELRDKFREIIAEALSRVHREAPEEMKDQVAACDPIRVAVSLESLMFEKLGRSNGAEKAKYRSIMFNMKDSKNPDLRRRVLLGHVKPAQLISMTPEEMASDARKRQNQQIKDKAIFECERGGPPKATTDQFKCGRCGKRKTTYHQMQTRSADEPMTTFVTCVECNHHWKFC